MLDIGARSEMHLILHYAKFIVIPFRGAQAPLNFTVTALKMTLSSNVIFSRKKTKRSFHGTILLCVFKAPKH